MVNSRRLHELKEAILKIDPRFNMELARKKARADNQDIVMILEHDYFHAEKTGRSEFGG